MSDTLKHFLITVAWLIGAIVVCVFTFIFLMRGVMELAQEYRAFSAASVNTSVQNNNTQYTNPSSSTKTNSPSTTDTINQTQWFKYISSSRDFSVMLPNKPEQYTSTQQQSVLNVFTTEVGDESYEIDRITSDRIFGEPTEKNLTSLVQGLAQSHGEVVDSISYDNNTQVARFILRSQSNDLMTKGIVIPRTSALMYVLQYGCIDRSCNENHYQYFVSSFASY